MSAQGRFTTVDPLLSSVAFEEPQSWNRYTYTLNNPLRYTDPTGMYVYDGNVSNDDRDKIDAALAAAGENLKKMDPKSKEYMKLKRALDVFGEKGKDNGLTINVKAVKGEGGHTELGDDKEKDPVLNPTRPEYNC